MQALTARQYAARLGACVAFLLALIIISPGIGTESAAFGWKDTWCAFLGIRSEGGNATRIKVADTDGDGAVSEQEWTVYEEQARHIGFSLRLPRTLLALQVGATLALCGAVFQVLFRNPLATPYTLGVASGGSLGAMLAIRFGWVTTVFGLSTVGAASFFGATMVVAAVYVVARGARRLTSNEMLLAGVTLGLFCSAMMMLVTSVSSERVTFAAVRWMMGSLDPMTLSQGVSLLPYVVPAWLILIGLSRAMNQYRLGDELAQTRGVHVRRLQGVCVLVCTVATAAVVARCGPIGFVGLVVPHIAALLFGADCRILLPASALCGGSFLILCDWASQLVMGWGGWLLGQELGSATLPIGVLTAIVGVPIFLILLRWRRA